MCIQAFMHGGLVAKLCLTLCGPKDGSPLGFSVLGVSQARLLEWVAISSPGNLPNPGFKCASPALQGDPLQLSHPVKIKS